MHHSECKYTFHRRDKESDISGELEYEQESVSHAVRIVSTSTSSNGVGRSGHHCIQSLYDPSPAARCPLGATASSRLRCACKSRNTDGSTETIQNEEK